MSERHTTLRSMHDLGLAAWFGGSLMGAVGVNGAAGKMMDSTQRLPIASTGWARWRPVNAAAIGAHLVGSAGELVTESPRVMTQSGVGRMSAIKTGLTAAALAATGYSGLLGMKLEKAGGTPVDGATEPNHQTPPDVAATQRQMKMLQWAIPALTGALIVIAAYAGEQQKPGQVFRGMIGRAGGMMSGGRKKGMMAGMSGRKLQKAVARSAPILRRLS
jgi:hypothetical protein